jgi:glyoxylase-like metal-dependent hydrolase (beta-lactamase superfamily II)
VSGEDPMNILAVSLPLPFALKQIIAYVVQIGNSLSIIDTGVHTEKTKEAWQQVFKERNWSFQQVEQIILTHYHPDHYGFAGTLQAWSRAKVYMAEREYHQIQSFWGHEFGNPTQITHFFRLYGFPLKLLDQITVHMKSFLPLIEPHPNVTFITAGETIDIGGEPFRILHTPGHSDGHLSFFHEQSGILFGGDILLPNITPNIPLLPKSDPNPLDTFLCTLEGLKKLPIEKVYPAHGKGFSNYQERIEELKGHHQRRLDKIMQFVRSKCTVNGYEVCQYLFAGKNLDIHNLRFAFSETLAHLEYLRFAGELHQYEEKGILGYQK